MTGRLDLAAVMTALAHKRPIFGSEADFQLALAWEIQLAYPSALVRLEYRPVYLDRRGYLDVWVTDVGWSAAIELKYFTRALDMIVAGERFELLNQGAQDISRYDFVRDVARVESAAQVRPGVAGYALALTNDSSDWRPPTTPRETIDAAFRLHEGVLLAGTLGWGSVAGRGTTRGREKPHELVGAYPLQWHDYSVVTSGPAGTFRYLLVEAPPSPTWPHGGSKSLRPRPKGPRFGALAPAAVKEEAISAPAAEAEVLSPADTAGAPILH